MAHGIGIEAHYVEIATDYVQTLPNEAYLGSILAGRDTI